ncbi:MAG: hypothetical protein GY943_04800 [Chloroflexi bacterium]|nr:hypothetical protein [Chloroflexota bacterium]
MIVSFGSIGLGLMWGWLIVLTVRTPRKRPFTNALALLLATAAIAATQFYFSGHPSLIRFFIATFLAYFAHMVWLRGLQQRKNNKGS